MLNHSKIINKLQLRSEKLETYQYDLDKLLNDLEKKEYNDYYNDIKNIKTFESQARILEELPIFIKPSNVINLEIGLEKKAWIRNNYLDYYSYKQKWMFLRRLYILSRLKQTINKAPLLDKKVSQRKGFNLLLKHIQQKQIQKVLNEYSIRKFAFNRLHYNLLLAKKYTKTKIANDNETASIFHLLSKFIKGFRYIKENCYDKRSNLISKKTIKNIVIKHYRYYSLKRGFKTLSSKIFQRKAIHKCNRKYRIKTIRKYFKYFVQLLQLYRGIQIKSLTHRKVKRIDYNRLKRSFHKLLDFRNKSHDNRVLYRIRSNVHRKYFLIKYLQVWKNYYHFDILKRTQFHRKYSIRNKKVLSKYISLWRGSLNFKKLNRLTIISNLTKAKKFYLKRHGLFYLQRWIHSMNFHFPKVITMKLKRRKIAKKRIYFNIWFHYTIKLMNDKMLNKKGFTIWKKLMIKKWIKTWILFSNKSKMLKNTIVLRVSSNTRKNDKKRYLHSNDKSGYTIKKVTNEVLNGRIFHCVCLKHMLLRWYQYLKMNKRKPKIATDSKAYFARKHSLFLAWNRVAGISKRLNEMYHYSHRHSKKKALRLFFSKLQNRIIQMVEENRILKNFNERIIRPIKIRKGFDALYNRYMNKEGISSDPRVRTCNLLRISKYLTDWKDNFFYEKELNHKVKSHHHIRNIVNLFKAVNVWKSVIEMKYESQRNNRHADKLRKETLISPFFSNWRLVAATRSFSITMNADHIVRNWLRRKYWFRLLNRFIGVKSKAIDCKATDEKRYIKIKRNILFYSFKGFRRKLQRLYNLKSMKQVADMVRTKNLKKSIFMGISKAVYAETQKYRNARNLWKSLSFKRSRKYLTKVQRRKLSLSLAHKKFLISSLKIAMKRLKQWKYRDWKRLSYMTSELGSAKYLIMKVSLALKKLKHHVSISAVRNRSLVTTMMHLLRKVFIRFGSFTSQKKVRRGEVQKFLYSRMKWGFNQFLRYSYVGKFKALLKKNRNRAKSKDIYFEHQNMYHPQYRLSLFGDCRVSKQRLIYQNAATWRTLIKLSKVFVTKLNDMKRSKKRNIRRFRYMKSYIISREFFNWMDYFQSKKNRKSYLILLLNDFKKKNYLRKLKQFSLLSKNYKIITNKILKKTILFWAKHKKSRLIAKKVIVKCILKLDGLMVKHRLDAWRDDINFQKLEEKKQQVYVMIRKRFYITKLRRLSSLRRKIRIIIRRFKGIKYSRTLKKVFVALMKNLEVKYKNQDKLKCANKFHLDFLRSYVLHRFYLLRRNRIAREFILTKKNKLLMSNIRSIQRNCNYFRSLIKKSNLLFMKKGFNRFKTSLALEKKAPKKKKELEKKNYTSRKMRILRNQKLDNYRAVFMMRVSLHHIASYIIKQDTFKDLYKDVNKYRNHRLMRKAIIEFLRNRRIRRRIRNSIKYLEKYYIDIVLYRSFKQIDTFACKSFSKKINMRLLYESSKQNRILHAFKKFIVRKRKYIETAFDFIKLS